MYRPKVSPDLSFGIQFLKRLHGANIVSSNVASVVVVFFSALWAEDDARCCEYKKVCCVLVFTVYMRTTSK